MPNCNRRACGLHIESMLGSTIRGAGPVRRLARAVILAGIALPLAMNISAGTLHAVDKSTKPKSGTKTRAGETTGRWKVKPDPPAETISWPDTLKFSISQPQQAEELLFPRSSSPFCLVGLKGQNCTI